MQIVYRISNNSYKKERLPVATKEYCLKDFIEKVVTSDDFMTIIADSVDDDLGAYISQFQSNNIKIIPITARSNGASFRFQLEYVRSFKLDEIVMFQEDDYIYKTPSWPYGRSVKYHEMIERALKFATTSHFMITRQIPPPKAGGNKFISPEGIETLLYFAPLTRTGNTQIQQPAPLLRELKLFCKTQKFGMSFVKLITHTIFRRF